MWRQWLRFFDCDEGQRRRFCLLCLPPDGAQVLVEPRKCLDRPAGVPALKKEMALVLLRSAQQLKQWTLAGFEREYRVAASIGHEDGHRDSRSEINQV